MREELQALWYMGASRRRSAKEKEGAGAGAGAGASTAEEPFDINKTIYRVRFTDCVELLRAHQGLLVGGWLYIEDGDLKAIVAGRYRAHLSQCLAMANKALPAVLRDERLAPMLNNMTKAYAGPEFGTGAKVRGGGWGALSCASARVIGSGAKLGVLL